MSAPRSPAPDSISLGMIDRADPTYLHLQVAAEIRRAIEQGEAKPGERIPQAKDLAAVLGVNTNTVLRALRLLRDEGLLELGRGRGIVVAGTPERGAVLTKLQELVEVAFGYVDLDWKRYVVQDPALVRPAEVDLLVGDPSKAKRALGWTPEVSFQKLIHLMVDADLERLLEILDEQLGAAAAPIDNPVAHA